MWSPELSTYRLGLSEHQIALGHTSLWSQSIARAEHKVHTVREPLSWSGAVATAAAALQSEPARRAALQVVLSGRFVRWQHVPWLPDLSGPAETVAYARARFVEVYGAPARDWHLEVALQQPGHSSLACAIDRPLMQALQSTAQTARLRLESVTPYFAAAHDHWRRTIADGSYWFGLLEPGYLTLGLVHQGQWLAVRGQRHQGDVPAVLQASIAQMGMACGTAHAAGRILLAGNVAPFAGGTELPVTWLKPPERPQPTSPDWRLAWGQ